jgi:hypothetical protein
MVTGETGMNVLTDGPFRIGTVLSKSLGILRNNIVLFTSLGGIAYALEILVAAMFEGIDAGPARPIGAQYRGVFAAQLTTTNTSTLSAATILYVVLHQLTGRPVGVGEVIAAIFSRFLPLMGIALLSFLAFIAAPLLIFIITTLSNTEYLFVDLSTSGEIALIGLLYAPGLILLTLWYVAIPVCVRERRGSFQSVSRSNALIKGARFKLFAFLVLQLALSRISVGLPEAIGSFVGYWGQIAVQFALASLYYAFAGTLIGVVYYELLVEKQGFDSNRVAAVFD